MGPGIQEPEGRKKPGDVEGRRNPDVTRWPASERPRVPVTKLHAGGSQLCQAGERTSFEPLRPGSSPALFSSCASFSKLLHLSERPSTLTSSHCSRQLETPPLQPKLTG